MSFILDDTLAYGVITDAIAKVKHVDTVEIFDLYSGEYVPAGKKSIGLRMQISGDGSLTTEEINAIMDKAIMSAE